MNFCQECGGSLKNYGLSNWSSGVWLYGCSKCDILWEQHGCSLTGRITECKRSSQKLSEWEQYEEEREAKTKRRENAKSEKNNKPFEQD